MHHLAMNGTHIMLTVVEADADAHARHQQHCPRPKATSIKGSEHAHIEGSEHAHITGSKYAHIKGSKHAHIKGSNHAGGSAKVQQTHAQQNTRKTCKKHCKRQTQDMGLLR
jgi:hypothetical protein